MLQIGICDDEPLLLDEIKEITEDCLQQQQAFSILSTYTDGKTLLYEIQDGKRFDLLLLDIEMPDLSGMELAKQIHGLLPDALMIFVTAHYKYAVDAYDPVYNTHLRAH
ncbi:MAG: response regulator, partial [Lachnospiraceae bacterium]|nr:response regulator [Lachnospiraceae bacterium]